MASPTQIHIETDNTGLWQVRQSADTASTVSSLLQEDLKTHNVFFNKEGFHNHITHHLLSLYGTGAPAGSIQDAYDANKTYQLPAKPPHSPKSSVETGTATNGAGEKQEHDWYETKAPQYLGGQSYYPDFLQFFQEDIRRRSSSSNGANGSGSGGGGGLAGWQAVVRERLLAGTPAADDLLVRLFAGFLHPLIQLQYGLEWQQPAIVAQGLAQAAVHKLQGLDEFLLKAEKKAEEEGGDGKDTSILSLYKQVAESQELAKAVRNEDGNKLRDGVFARAGDAMLAVAAQVRVRPTEADVARRTAEMAEACLYVSASAALQHHPRKHPKFDFFLIHHVNSVPFFLTLNSFDWVPIEAKARLLAWKIRMDLVQYAARACPPLQDPAVIQKYKSPPSGTPEAPATEAATSTKDISPEAAAAAARLFHFEDDGHAIKLIRASGLIERVVQKSEFADAPWRILKSDAAWEALYRLETDSVRGPGNRWVRTTGLPEAWEGVRDEAPPYES